MWPMHRAEGYIDDHKLDLAAANLGAQNESYFEFQLGIRRLLFGLSCTVDIGKQAIIMELFLMSFCINMRIGVYVLLITFVCR